MGVVCTPTTPPRIPILLRSTASERRRWCMHESRMHESPPFLMWGSRAVRTPHSAAPTRGGLYPPPLGNKAREKQTCHVHVVFLLNNSPCELTWIANLPMRTCMGECLPMRILAWASLPGGPPPGTRSQGPHVAPHMHPFLLHVPPWRPTARDTRPWDPMRYPACVPLAPLFFCFPLDGASGEK